MHRHDPAKGQRDSASVLRRASLQARGRHDPDGSAPAFDPVVLIGQGLAL